MFMNTYHIKDPYIRTIVDLLEFENDLIQAIKFFPMVKLVGITQNTYTITIDTDDVETKNRIVRALGDGIASTSLKKYVIHTLNANFLFVEKKPKNMSKDANKNESTYVYTYSMFIFNRDWKSNLHTDSKSFSNK